MSNRSVVVLNASFEILGSISWQDAVEKVVSEKATIIDHHPTDVVRSQHLIIPMPEMIVLKKYVLVPYRDMLPNDEKMATRQGILKRDGLKCGYCGQPGYTIDHIWPQSLGGETTWENCITACRPCNLKKSNMTPQEAEDRLGMKLHYQPKAPVRNGDLQKKVWKRLQEKQLV